VLVGLVLDGPIEAVVLLGTLSPLLYYGRLFFFGIERPGRTPRVPWRPVISGIDLTHLQVWLVRTWSDNRLVTATGSAALLAMLALVVSAGAFGSQQAAAGLPPTIDTSVESFAPGEPLPPEGSDAPSAAPPDATPGDSSTAPSAPASPSPEPSASTSFEPVPTT
jgi:hypothetical protein